MLIRWYVALVFGWNLHLIHIFLLFRAIKASIKNKRSKIKRPVRLAWTETPQITRPITSMRRTYNNSSKHRTKNMSNKIIKWMNRSSSSSSSRCSTCMKTRCNISKISTKIATMAVCISTGTKYSDRMPCRTRARIRCRNRCISSIRSWAYRP